MASHKMGKIKIAGTRKRLDWKQACFIPVHPMLPLFATQFSYYFHEAKTLVLGKAFGVIATYLVTLLGKEHLSLVSSN